MDITETRRQYDEAMKALLKEHPSYEETKRAFDMTREYLRALAY